MEETGENTALTSWPEKKGKKGSLPMSAANHANQIKEDFQVFLKWSLLGLLIGTIGGVLGTAFHYILNLAAKARGENPWLLFLLPLGGLLTVGLYQAFHLRNNRGTNEIIDAILNQKPVNPLIAPLVFVSTAITHLFGGSAGREGAALQLGAASASALAKLFHLKEEDRMVLIMSGMSAVFSGLFGTPLTATLFTMEFESVGTIFSPALLPCYLAAFTASSLSAALGIRGETAVFGEALPISLMTDFRVLLLGIGIGILGIGMCCFLHKAVQLAEKWLPNAWLRITVGAFLVVGMTLLVGNQRYNGAGMDVALEAIGGSARWYDFLLKLLFTAITLAAGFKGGEIVPTFCIGATFGCVVGGFLGLDPGFAAALSLVGLFCCVTNSPITALALSVEMFGSANLPLFALICVVGFVISGNWGLYSSQIIQFSEAKLIHTHHPKEPEAAHVYCDLEEEDLTAVNPES